MSKYRKTTLRNGPSTLEFSHRAKIPGSKSAKSTNFNFEVVYVGVRDVTKTVVLLVSGECKNSAQKRHYRVIGPDPNYKTFFAEMGLREVENGVVDNSVSAMLRFHRQENPC